MISMTAIVLGNGNAKGAKPLKSSHKTSGKTAQLNVVPAGGENTGQANSDGQQGNISTPSSGTGSSSVADTQVPVEVNSHSGPTTASESTLATVISTGTENIVDANDADSIHNGSTGANTETVHHDDDKKDGSSSSKKRVEQNLLDESSSVPKLVAKMESLKNLSSGSSFSRHDRNYGSIIISGFPGNIIKKIFFSVVKKSPIANISDLNYELESLVELSGIDEILKKYFGEMIDADRSDEVECKYSKKSDLKLLTIAADIQKDNFLKYFTSLRNNNKNSLKGKDFYVVLSGPAQDLTEYKSGVEKDPKNQDETD